MKDVLISPSTVEPNSVPESVRSSPRGLSHLAGKLFAMNADRWRRRASFYERHRDYFPRIASSPFVDRCRELEAAYGDVARLLFAMPPRIDLVPVQVTVSRVRYQRQS